MGYPFRRSVVSVRPPFGLSFIASVPVVEPLGQSHESQVFALPGVTTTSLGWTPTGVTLNGVPQTFQIGADNTIVVQNSLQPNQTLYYILTG